VRILVGILLLVLLLLQARLWFGDGGVSDISLLSDRVAAQQEDNRMLLERNNALRAEVEDLRERLDAVEERARSELGLIREGEQFIQVVPENLNPVARPAPEPREPEVPDPGNGP
jgi:cell division protein FtsB